MKTSFKKSVKENLEAISLDEKQLEQLMAMQERYIYKPAPRTRSRNRLFWYKIYGVGVLSLFGIVVLLTMTGLLSFDDTLSPTNHVANYKWQVKKASTIQRIADEVAANHLKMKPLEVKATEIAALQNYFNQLDFSPYNAKPLADNTQIALAGGRYCSIQGVKAAQLRYKDAKGGYVTLFEAAYNAELFDELPDIDKGETPVVTYTKGIKVSMWVEKGIVMVSTEKFR